MIALLDGDLITYPCAFSAEGGLLEDALSRVDSLVRKILYNLNTEDVEIYLNGTDNFRYNIYSDYKAQRAHKPKPQFLEDCREYLVKYWNASLVNGMETDDKLGIQATKYGLDSIICSFDKDLDQVPGFHYNWKKDIRYLVSPLEGLRTFYRQVIAGDGADNIPSFDGKVRNSIPNFIRVLQEPIDEMVEEDEMYLYVREVYGDVDNLNILNTNCSCLWVLREEEQYWMEPTISENIKNKKEQEETTQV